MIYLDNAATTMHKPQTVIDAVTQAMCFLCRRTRRERRCCSPAAIAPMGWKTGTCTI